ncbi:uncharacterized protein LOC130436438 [Triplophysa dalaica]|uniref:uncharacterized protein LOC130436438 n=1 Tax=Triplophysa dalaica TaxID=1582913 RepID=UPI0024DF88C4|nr:uncharacterized protein LOC130436438 [Triplophysa dalaica]
MSLPEKQSERSGSPVDSSVSMRSDHSQDDRPNFSQETPSTTRSERSGSSVFSSVSVKSDHSQDDRPNFSEKTPSATRSERSGSPAFSSVSVKSDHSQDNRPNFSEKTPSATSERSGSPAFSSVSVKSDHSQDNRPNFSEKTPSETRSERSGSSVFSSVSVKSDHSQDDRPNFSEKTLSATRSERSGSSALSSVSMKSDHSQDNRPNFSEKTPSATRSERSGSPAFSSVSVKSDHSQDNRPNFSEKTPSETRSERSGSSVFSSVSVKSDHSQDDRPNFSEKTLSATRSERSGSSALSSVSMKSDHSQDNRPNFSEKTPSATRSERSGSPAFSSVSVKSDHSQDNRPNFSEKTPSETRSERSGSSVFSSVSVKSDHSQDDRPNFSEKTLSATRSERSGSPAFSSVSVKSDHSQDDRPNFSEKTPSANRRNQWPSTVVNIGLEMTRWKTLKKQKGIKSDEELASFLLNMIQIESSNAELKMYRVRKDFREHLLWIFQDLENKIITFLKNELERFKKILKKENTQYFVKDLKDDRNNIREAALDITLYFLRSMKQDKLADVLEDELVFIHQRQLKSNLKKKYQCVFEGIAKQGDSTLLNKIYTDLYITQGGGEQVNTQHEIRQIEAASKRLESPEIQIECTNLFQQPGEDQTIRTVVTKGVAGIGKSVSVQKFVLDWTEEKENKDISFIFPVPFREMNLKEKQTLSLRDLINHFFPEIKGLNLTRNNKFKILFIFDGLDECRLPLKFSGNETWSDITTPAPLDVLLTNLIKGNLLPSALIWITTRPAAAGKIPPDCIDRVTEVRGFNDAQKEEYFRKRFSDENMADAIIDHVKKSKSLYIMCHIPVFCWISATVLQNILEKKNNQQSDDTTRTLQESNTDETPRTLTQMYTHFFRFQIQQSRRKYDGEHSPDISWDRDAILSLGKLAFQQLERNNLIFYASDLEACGIEVSKASVYSGMCTQIFKQETGIILGTMYCFVHMSIQEFIASLYAHLFLDTTKTSAFVQEHTEVENNSETMIGLLKTAVDKALESENGHLDLFLRFLLGLSLDSNRPLLQGLLTQQDSNEQTYKEIVAYIKQKFDENSSPERSINLFYCLNELNDQSLVQEVQKHLREGSLSSADLSPAQWSALVFVLLTSDEELEDFELQKFKKSDECLIRLWPVVKASKRALLNDCNLSDKCCSALANVVGSESSLKELNVNNNNLKDSGVKLLYAVLEKTKSKLEILRLSKCDLTDESCSALTSVLSSDSSSLLELDLSNNNLKDSGVKLLSDGLKNPNCKLKILNLSECSITEGGYVALSEAVRSNPSHLIELDLTGNDPGPSGVKLIYDLIQDTNCALNAVRFLKSSSAVKAVEYLKKTLDINPLLEREVNLSNRVLNDSRVKQICDLLQDKHCKLNTLMLSSCSITAEGCAALTEALNVNPSHVKELNLSGNTFGDSGIKNISDLIKNSQCTLKKLKLSECSITEEGYVALSEAVRSNPSHLIELDLTGNDPGPSGVKRIYDLIQDTNCAMETVRFLNSSDAEAACVSLTDVLGVNPLLLKELNLSDNKLRDLDGEKLSALLMDSHSKVKKIILNKCKLTEKQCSAVASVLSCKTLVREMNLNNSRLLDSGLKHICEGLKNPQCQLQILNLSECSITEGGYRCLSEAVRSNPSHLIELDLTGNDPGPSGVKLIYDLIQDTNCALNTVRFLKSSSAVEAFEYLKTLHINPLLQREMNLKDHKLDESRVKQICDLLQDTHCKLKTLTLRDCGLTEESCSSLASVLRSNSSVTELNMSNNNLLDSGVKKLQKGLEHTNCKLKKLSLSECSITEGGYVALSEAVRSNPSHLIELDLTGNDPGPSGVKLIYDLIQDTNCALNTVRFLKSSSAVEAFEYLKTLDINPLLQREVNLKDHKLDESRVKQICDLLQDKHCKLNTLILKNCGLTEERCSSLASVLSSNFSVTELDMSNNKLLDSGVKKLQKGLEHTNCKLKKLRLSECSITEGGYRYLSEAVRSNPSHLIELDLTGNDPGPSGVKLIYDLIQDTNCALNTVRFLRNLSAMEAVEYLMKTFGINALLQREVNLKDHKLDESRVKQISDLLQDKHCRLNTLMLSSCSITAEGCAALTEALNVNPSHVKELNLSGNTFGDSGIKNISDLMKNSHCTLEKLKLSCISVTAEGCAALASAFISNPSHLRELDLCENKLEDSGIKEISTFLRYSYCRLENLRLSECSITEEGYRCVSEAVRSNPSHLIELDLTGNDPGPSGVKLIYDLIQDTNCELNTVRFLKSPDAEAACVSLTDVLGVNPLLLKELNLSDNKLRDLDGEKLSALLMDSHSKVEKIILNKCELTEKQCSAVASVLSCKTLVREMNLNNSRLLDSGLKHICEGLKNPQCHLNILNLSECSITEEGYRCLSEAVRSNPSHLIELDLTGNDPGPSGVKLIYDLIQDTNCALNTVSLLKSPTAQKLCDRLTPVLGQSPLLLREMDLSKHINGDSDVKSLSDLMADSHCKLQILKLNESNITREGYAALASAFILNPSNLRQLDLSKNELGDPAVKKICTLLEHKDCKLEKLMLNNCSLTENDCDALSSALNSNPSHLKELELSENKVGDSGVNHLCSLLQNSLCKLTKLKVRNCELTEKSCSSLSAVLSSENTSLIELDMSINHLRDSGTNHLCTALENPQCELQILSVSECSITEGGYVALSKAVRSNPSHLIELDLTGNDPGPSGVKLIYDLIQDTNCALNTVRFVKSPDAEAACVYLTDVLGVNPLLLKELNLSDNKLRDLDGEKLSALLMDSHSKVEKIILNKCELTEKQCSAVASVLSCKTLVREMNLNNSRLLDSGLKHICEGLKNPQCQLHILKLSECSITEGGYVALSEAVRSNPSHLIELDLTGNDPGPSGGKLLYDLIQDTNCALNTVRFLKSSSAVEAFDYLKTLDINALLQREVNLSNHELDESRVKQICDLLQDKHCRLNTLILRDCGLTEESCPSLASVLRSNSSVTELNMSNNNLLDSGVKKLQEGLEHTNCKLKKLRLSECSITEGGYVALSEAVRSNPSHLIELDLTGNDPGPSGVKLIYDLIQDTKCKLNTVRFLKSSSAAKGFKYLKTLDINPLLQREVNLSDHELDESRVKQICDLLQDKHCRLNTLTLSSCSITAEGCAALTEALNVNPSHVKELNLSGNTFGDSGIKKISDLMKNSQCTLKKLNLSECSITEGGYVALSKAVRSNPSHLIELDLTGNDPGPSGVKLIYDLIQDANCKLNTVRFLKSPDAEAACVSLTDVLGVNPLLLKELNLSDNKLRDLDGEKLSALLMDSHSTVEKIIMNECELTEKQCSAVASVLSCKTLVREMNLNNSRLLDSGLRHICEGLKNPQCHLHILNLNKCDLTEEMCSALTSVLSSDSSSLLELDLSNNNLQDSGVKLISDGLKNPNCKLHILSLSECSITEEGYRCLSEAVRSNPSHLIELDLTGNDPGPSGVKLIYDLIQDTNCELNTVRFLKSDDAEAACVYLTDVLGVNPLLLKELNLSDNKLRDLDGEKLSALLMDSHSKVKKIILNNCELTEKQCSAVASVLSCKTLVREMNLNNSRLLDSGLKHICEGLKNPQCHLHILNLNKCDLTEESCSALTSVLSSDSSSLLELDLSNNNLQDSGVKLLSDGLKNQNCKLKILNLSECSITEGGYVALSEAVRSNPSHLIELDLTGNDPGPSGVKLIYDLIQDTNCKLNTVRFVKSPDAEAACVYLTDVLGVNPLLLKELNLSDNKLRDLDGEKLSALLMDSHSKVKKIILNKCELTEKQCSAVASVLSCKTLVREMNLNNSRLLDSGLKHICEGLKNPQCHLHILKLSECSITEEGYRCLSEAVRSNPSHLIELDLTGNDPGPSGVKLIYDLIQDTNCELNTVRFLKSSSAVEGFEYLKTLDINPLLQREMNLKDHKLDESRVKQICDLLQDKHCKLNTLILRDCGLTEESCSSLASVLRSNSSLTELDMSNNKLLDSGVKKLQKGLEHTNCKLKKLSLSECSLTEEGYVALSEAVRSNPSHLIELDLTGNDPGPSGVKLIYDLIQDTNCALNTVRFLKSSSAVEAFKYLKTLDINPLLQREMNLSNRVLNDSRVKQICDLLQDKHCKLNTLILRDCGFTAENCTALASVLRSNSSVTELNMNNNNLLDSGVKKLQKGLEHTNCKLKKLRLSECSITERGYVALSEAVRSNPSHLIELDLTGNDPGPSGVKLIYHLIQDTKCALYTVRFLGNPSAIEAVEYLMKTLDINPLLQREVNLKDHKLDESRVKQISDLLQDKHCKLNTIMLSSCSITAEGCAALTEALNVNPSHVKELNLSGNTFGDSGIKKISNLMKNSQCTLKKLKLSSVCVTAEGCVALASAFRSNPSHLTELDLSENNLEDSGVKEISTLLRNSYCRLKNLRLSGCSIAEGGYRCLSEAVRSNPSHLIELDLTGNDPGPSGVKLIYDLIQDTNCALNTVRFLKSPDAEAACVYLTDVLGVNPLLLKELNLSDNKLRDLDGEKLSALLMDSHSKVKKIILNKCELTEKQCSAVASVLSCKTLVREMNLNNSRLLDSGLKHICEGLKNPQCHLHILNLSECSITEGGYRCLSEAVRSNPSHLIELDLTGNDPGPSGVKRIYDLIQDTNCALNTVRFLKSSSAVEALNYLSRVLGCNVLLQRELNLSNRKLDESRVKQICDLLQDKHCKIKKLILRDCGLTEESCSSLASVLSSNSSLTELDMNNNKLLDSGVKKLQKGLEHTNCKLKKLSLSECSITEEGYVALSEAVRSNPSHLIELDLTGNDPGPSGVQLIYDLIQDTNCKLKTVKFLRNRFAFEASEYLTGCLGINALLQRKLNLVKRKLDVSRVKQICDLLQDKHCRLNTLKFNYCSITAEGCAALTEALNVNPSHVKELNLSGNTFGDSGIKKISDLMKNSQCTLKKLNLSECSITEEGYRCLYEAVRSNPSHLIELDLTGNDPGPSGVKLIYDLIQDTNCALKTLRFLKSDDAEAACVYLTDVLGLNPLLLKELNLSDNKLRDLDGEKLSALLMDSHSKVEKIILNECELTEKQCSAVASVLSCKTLVREMNLNNSRLLDSGLKHICEGLKNPQCQLQILNLSECSITEGGYRCLYEAVRSNPSHLIELDLTGNDPGPSGVKLIHDLIQDKNCKLKTVRFLKSSSAVEAFEYLMKTLDINPLLQREVNLSHKLDESRVKQISDLLQDKHCKLNTLILRDCGLTEESCSSLASVLRSNSSVTELNMSNNNLLDSGVKKLQKGLEHTNCKLKKLSLSECSITEEGYRCLSEAVRSNPSHLIELDLTGNDPGPSGVKLIYNLIQDTNCALNTVRFLKSSSAVEGFEYLKTLHINPLLQREMNLKDHKLDESRVKQICDLLQDKHCTLHTLRLSGGSITKKCIDELISALCSNCSHLRHLNLSKNELGTSGVNKLSDLLKNPQCTLKTLVLCECRIDTKQLAVLIQALCSNPSHLRELNLSQNKIKDDGVKHLCDLLKHCELKKLELCGCSLIEEQCAHLISALCSNPSHLKHLNLSGNKLGTLGVNKLSDLLKNPQCKLKTLVLCECRIDKKQLVVLIQALCSNPSHLRELNLSENEITDDEVKHLCDLLKHCELEKLELCGCSLTEDQCAQLISALCSNPSHLKHLNLSGNKPGHLGVEVLCDLLKHSKCKLKKLKLNDCSITDVSCLAETQAVRRLKVLDLSKNKLGNSEKLREMLKDSNCKLRLKSQGWLSWGLSLVSGKSAAHGDESSSSHEEDEDTSSQKNH